MLDSTLVSHESEIQALNITVSPLVEDFHRNLARKKAHLAYVDVQKMAYHAHVKAQLEAKKQSMFDLEQRAFQRCRNNFAPPKFHNLIDEFWNAFDKSFESLFRALLFEDVYFKFPTDEEDQSLMKECMTKLHFAKHINIMYQLSAKYGSTFEARLHWIINEATFSDPDPDDSDEEYLFYSPEPAIYGYDGRFIKGRSNIIQYLNTPTKKTMNIPYLESLREKNSSSSLNCANSSSDKPSIDTAVANLPFDRGPFHIPTTNDDDKSDSGDSSAKDAVVHALRARLELFDNDGNVRSMPLISDGSINSDASDNSHDGELTDANSSQEKYNQDDFSTAVRSNISDNENDDNDDNFEDSSGKTCDDTDNYADNAYVDASGDDYYDNYADNAYVDASGDDYYNDSFGDYDYQDDQS
jgi:hypothetical protein